MDDDQCKTFREFYKRETKFLRFEKVFKLVRRKCVYPHEYMMR